MIRLTVIGTPAPKGSSRAMLIGGQARLIASGTSANARAQAAWVKAIREAALEVAPNQFYSKRALRIAIVFRVARPKGHYTPRGLRPSAPAYPNVYPDIDKLVRCTLDALTGVLFDDDSRIVALSVTKEYAASARTEGASIGVAAMDGRDACMPDGPNDNVPRESTEAA